MLLPSVVVVMHHRAGQLRVEDRDLGHASFLLPSLWPAAVTARQNPEFKCIAQSYRTYPMRLPRCGRVSLGAPVGLGDPGRSPWVAAPPFRVSRPAEMCAG